MTGAKPSLVGSLLRLGGAAALLAGLMALSKRLPAPIAREVPPNLDEPAASARPEVITYGIGYGLALVLTIAAFALVRWHWTSPSITLGIVFGLALVQMVVHFRCFLHVTLHGPARDDLQLILFSTLIVILMVAGTLVLLFNLRMRMM